MDYLIGLISIIIFVIGFLIYEKGGSHIFDLTTAGILISGGIVFLYWLVKTIRPALKEFRSKKAFDDSVSIKNIPDNDKDVTIDELRIVAKTRIEDGESANAVVEYLIQHKHLNKLFAETIVTDLYKLRQKEFRYLGIFYFCIGGAVLVSSFVFYGLMNDLLSEANRWSAHQIASYVHTVKIVLWGIALYFSIKGITRLLFGGKGIKTKRPI